MTTSDADDDLENESHVKDSARLYLRTKRNAHSDIAVMTKAAGQFTAPLLRGMARETRLDFLQCLETRKAVKSPQLAVGASYTLQLECGHNGMVRPPPNTPPQYHRK